MENHKKRGGEKQHKNKRESLRVSVGVVVDETVRGINSVLKAVSFPSLLAASLSELEHKRKLK